MRVRFAPSPTGYLHIGGARTVLFNWLLARKNGGAFVLRIEDTDRNRHVEDSVQKITDDLRWLGLTWDEGPQVDGPYGPYFQSERLDIYNRYTDQLLESGHAYFAMETPEELEAMRARAKADGRTAAYLRPDPLPTPEQGRAARAAGRQVVVRLATPAVDITVEDDILGSVTLASGQVEDFVIQKGDGWPTYHFACVVDDELMKITHVLRGQEHLMNTPKHIALQRALGFGTPRYAHLPVIFNMDGSKMSKRDKERALKKGEAPPEIDVHDFRVAGYLPEALLNFIALLGWSPGDDREFFDLAEMTKAFSVERVGKVNAKFDREKLLSFNTTWATKVSPDRLLAAFRDFLKVSIGSEPGFAVDQRQSDMVKALREQSDSTLREVLRICAGFRTFTDVVKKAGFIFVTGSGPLTGGGAEIRAEGFVYDPAAVQKVLAKNSNSGFAMLEHLIPKLNSLTDWTAPAIDALLESICQDRQAKMGDVAQPLRVAVSGTTVSPAIGETLALLGREKALARIRNCLRLLQPA